MSEDFRLPIPIYETTFEKDRPEWKPIFMTTAHLIAQRSTCLKLKTGALLVKDNRIISIGYNGSVPKGEHCCDYWKKYYGIWYFNEEFNEKYPIFGSFLESLDFSEKHHEWATINEIHGEQNAILYASKNGISTKDSEMYSVYSPCINCAKVIITSGITKVYFSKHYKRDVKGIKFLVDNGIKCEQVPFDDILSTVIRLIPEN